MANSRVVQQKPIVMVGSGRSQGNGIVTEYVDNPFFLRRLHGCRRSTRDGPLIGAVLTHASDVGVSRSMHPEPSAAASKCSCCTAPKTAFSPGSRLNHQWKAASRVRGQKDH